MKRSKVQRLGTAGDHRMTALRAFAATRQLVGGLSLLACLFVAGCDEPPSNSGPGLVGQVTQVLDGDTIEVARVPIRLSGLTCDERETPRGDSATAFMRDLVSGQTLSCDLTGETTYNRQVGRCRLSDGTDIGAAMISVGECGRCARYDRKGSYRQVQAEAGAFQGSMPGYCLG